MATAQDLIDAAIRKQGVGIITPSTTLRANGLEALNNLLSSWSAERLLVFAVTRENFTLTVDKASYTIGNAGGEDLSTVRPSKIMDAYLRDSNSFDSPLNIGVLSRYDRITDKAVDGRPRNLYYLQEYAAGKILFDYEPDEAYTLFLDSWKQLGELAALGTTVSLPNEYKRFLTNQLAIEISSEYDSDLPQEVFRIARESKDAIEDVNFQPPRESTFDAALTGRGGYNINTDESR